MKKAYLAISYSNRKKMDKEVNSLKSFLKAKNIALLVFVDRYNFKDNQEKEMMQTAFNEIDNCDLLIAELTTKSIGVGIEIGYAFATKKRIVYLYKESAEYSTTASGSATVCIAYKNTSNLIKQLELKSALFV